LAIVKSKILVELSENYPNFYKKDLEKFLDIFLYEIINSLKKGNRVELRDFGMWECRTQAKRTSRNPKTGEKIETPQKKYIHFKMAKELFNFINETKKI
tara:strand:+ start:212 stop:508 length:297 start_codon:yes stop_codon:yes gene_type:complete